MADISGRLTDQAGGCVASLGSGAINLLLGTADANTDSVPLVAISAQGGLNRIYKESHQIVDLVSMFRPVTKWAELIQRPEAVPEMVRKAFKLAQTERLRIPVATTFMGKGVLPDNHPNALGTIGFMVHDYANFGFDQADVILCVGYDMQEFDPIKINPTGDKQ